MHPRIPGGKIAIYARFSSENQREASIEDQVRRCREYIAFNGGEPEKALIFPDRAISGSSLERPGFEALMLAVEHKEVDVIVTEDLSRISRDFADAAMVFRRLRFADVPLIGVADGIDTSAKDAKLSFTLKSLVVDLYLDDLRDKTKRGLTGRALAGYSTGSRPYGYGAELVQDATGRKIGYRVCIDEQGAEVVRRIFTEYAEGRSLSQIAYSLNADGIPCASAHKRKKNGGWCAATIRFMLRNEKYVGTWTYRKTEAIKMPGTNRRVIRDQDPSQTLTFEREELRIVAPELWQAVQTRLTAMRRKYNQDNRTKADERVIAGNKSRYPLSGLLVCGMCDGIMVVFRGSTRAYYRCNNNLKRNTCENRRTIRIDRLQPAILQAIRERLMSRDGIAYVRKRVASELGKVSQRLDRQLEKHRGRLAETEERIQRLIEFIATGQRSDYIAGTLGDLEASAKAERSTIAQLTHAAAEPIRLPSIDEVTAMVFDLDARLTEDPDAGRQLLRQWLKGHAITLTPLDDGRYQIKGGLLPLMVLGSARKRQSKSKRAAAGTEEKLSEEGEPSSNLQIASEISRTSVREAKTCPRLQNSRFRVQVSHHTHGRTCVRVPHKARSAIQTVRRCRSATF